LLEKLSYTSDKEKAAGVEVVKEKGSHPLRGSAPWYLPVVNTGVIQKMFARLIPACPCRFSAVLH